MLHNTHPEFAIFRDLVSFSLMNFYDDEKIAYNVKINEILYNII